MSHQREPVEPKCLPKPVEVLEILLEGNRRSIVDGEPRQSRSALVEQDAAVPVRETLGDRPYVFGRESRPARQHDDRRPGTGGRVSKGRSVTRAKLGRAGLGQVMGDLGGLLV